ncbi:MFS transporter [Mesorhizobium sp. BAC0120]|uniref:MFS transporter n=1 Tax=Mesorhizobium sp. BAC0120 TaxID=3090670 RepID=UPI00298BDAB7|nr:MFS transporter [Mesorhizobium sp. BAC0120]MDW6020486.1 MFS transporter [Mesorhizobium sp. BAC0120]
MTTSDYIQPPARRPDRSSGRPAGANDNRLGEAVEESRAASEPVRDTQIAATDEVAHVENARPIRPQRGLFRRLLANPDEPPPSLPAPAPYVPKHPLLALCYALTSVMIAITYGLGLNFVNANLQQVSGEFSATTNEAVWLTAAYMAPNVSLSLLLVKIRAQYGLRRFAEIAIVVFMVVNGLHLFANELGTAIVARFFAGIAAAPMSTLSFLYLLECFPPQHKMTVGMPLVMVNTTIGAPIARLISPALLDLGGWQPIYLLEVGLALVSFALIYTLPLTSPPKVKVLGFMDVVSYLFLALGFGALAVALSVGRYYWWLDAPWLGWVIALSVASLACVAVIELNRKYPLLDIKWLFSPEILHFAGVLILFRMLLTEQSSGVSGFFQQLGLQNDQQVTLNAVILAASIGGGLICAAVLKPGREGAIHAVSLALLAVGAFMDSELTVLTRPEQMYVSQTLIAVANSLFLAPAMAMGFVNALKKGMNYILSFVCVFLFTQSVGGLIGSALFGTFVIVREKFHSAAIVEHLALTNPFVAERVAQLGGAYSKVLTDPVLRQAEGVALLAQQASQQAYALAYADAFRFIALAAALSLCVLLLHLGWKRLAGIFHPAPLPAVQS